MTIITKLIDAIAFAADKHRMQRRKDVKAHWMPHPSIAVLSLTRRAARVDLSRWAR